MSQYIHFTEEQKEQAASVDLESFLLHRGEKLIASGHEKRLLFAFVEWGKGGIL